MKCAVVIPNYKDTLSHNEEISFSQCLSLLGNHDIFFISPNGVNNVHYLDVKGVKYYSEEYFENRDSYSRFMLESTLYEDFAEYEYILIYQLDAFVFKDELDDFCELGYDYIGAPWPYGICLHTVDESKVVYVGNGGFSLRRVKAFVDWIEKYRYEIKYLQEHVTISEDFIIAFLGKLNIAPKDVAGRFAVEGFGEVPDFGVRTGPFGCHNVISYNYIWAKEKYSEFGYRIEPPKKDYAKNGEIKRKEAVIVGDGTKEIRLLEAIDNLLQTESIFIWGTGFYGKKVLNLCRRYGINIEAFIETQKKRDDLLGVRILESEIFFSQEERKKVIVAMLNDSDVVKELQRHDYKRKQEFVTVTDLIDYLYDQ